MDILRSVSHPDEIVALLKFKLKDLKNKNESDSRSNSEDLEKCYSFLKQTSRSFSAVIQALDGELRDAVCIFYLVLRALDTVEDDMTIINSVKIPMLRDFHTYLEKNDWNFTESQEKDKIVLEEFPAISAEFRRLDLMYREIISSICKQMGAGMIEYLDCSPGSLKDWDKYCHYVAGLVGIGLSKLFSASNLEDEIVGQDEKLSNSMGQFLQKTNIIRDYLEDVNDARHFWPKEVWGEYVTDLPELCYEKNQAKALECLNRLITNALEHIPDCIEYLSRIKNQSVFNFCAIPQVMAIATLERCFNNYEVFQGVVKIRKGEAVRLMLEATDIEQTKAIFSHFTRKISDRVDPADHRTNDVITNTVSLTATNATFVTDATFFPLYVSLWMMMCALIWHYWHGFGDIFANVLQ